MCVLLRNRHTGSGYKNHHCSHSFSRDVATERPSRELFNNTLQKGKRSQMPNLIIKFVLLNSGRKIPEIKPDTGMLPVISAAGLR